MSIERIATLFERCGGPEKNFPPTDLYNEGWMLRLVLDWLSFNPGIDHDLAFATTDKWYSEALIPSAFLPRVRGDKLAESWTHADGVIGDFVIGANREGDLSLAEGASRILVTEAKMFSKLSSGVKNASYFNQAARNVACIAEVICRAQISPSSLEKIGFFVIAPESQINDGVFAEQWPLKEYGVWSVAEFPSISSQKKTSGWQIGLFQRWRTFESVRSLGKNSSA